MIDLSRDLRPDLLHWHRSTLRPAWRCAEIQDDHTRIYLPLAGEAWVKVAGRQLDLRPGRCFLIPPGPGRSFGCQNAMTLYWLHCRPLVWEAVDLWRLAQPRLEIPASATIHAAMERISSLKADNPLELFEGDGLCRMLLARFLPSLPTIDEAAWVRPVVDYIEAHLDESLRASDLARRAGWDRAYFSRRFRQTLGLPPMRFVRLRRVQRARAMLASKDWSVQAVAEKTGFHDAFHLSRSMHEILGLRPSQIRRRAVQGPALP
jgi:AraC-like DNA-binding protein